MRFGLFGYCSPAEWQNESTGFPESLKDTQEGTRSLELCGGLRNGAASRLPAAHDNGDPLGSLAYPLICSSKPLWLSPRALIGDHPSSRISLAKRLHAPAPRLLCGTSKASKIACVPIRSTLSSPTLPRMRSSRSRHGSAFRAAISACASLILVTHETIAYLHAISLPNSQFEKIFAYAHMRLTR